MNCPHWCRPGAPWKNHFHIYKWSYKSFNPVCGTEIYRVIAYLYIWIALLLIINDGAQMKIVQKVVFDFANSNTHNEYIFELHFNLYSWNKKEYAFANEYQNQSNGQLLLFLTNKQVSVTKIADLFRFQYDLFHIQAGLTRWRPQPD